MSIYTGPFRYAGSHTEGVVGNNFADILSIAGNANTNVHVLSMGVSANQTTDEFELFTIFKRSTPTTGGTSTVVHPVALNSNSPASSTSVVFYTATPNYGTLLATLWDGYVMCNVKDPTNDVAGFSGVTINFVDLCGGPVDLLSASETLGIGIDGNAPAGLNVAAWVSWYETFKS